MIRRESQGVVWYEFEILAACPNVRHGVFARHGGLSADPWSSLNVSLSVGDDERVVWENRRRLVRSLGLDPARLVTARQVHGSRVSAVNADVLSSTGPTSVPESDSLLTVDRGLSLAMTFADCVPLLFHDPRRGVIGIAHAGWRGTLTGVGPATVKAMVERFGSAPSEILVGIGPSIGPCCYEVGEEVVAAARGALGGDEAPLMGEAGGWRLDLWEANRRLLVHAGISQEHVEVGGVCTACNTQEFFSHRKERGRTGRFGAAIGLRAD